VRVRRWNIGYPDPELRLLPRFCKQTSVDVGASLGLYTMHMLGYASEVWAFEPRPAQAAQLRSSLGADSRLHIEAVALSDRMGTGRFRACPADAGRSTLEAANPLSGLAVDEIIVPVRTLDSYQLVGAARTLEVSRPALFLELEDRHNPGITDRVPRWLSAFGYQQYYLLNGRLTPAAASTDSTQGGNSVFLCSHHRRT
jgi:FkbM family methyltransferase